MRSIPPELIERGMDALGGLPIYKRADAWEFIGHLQHAIIQRDTRIRELEKEVADLNRAIQHHPYRGSSE